MNYYAHYTSAGKILYKEETNNECSGIGIKKLTKEQYDELDVSKEQEVYELKKQLADTDYIACKIAEGAATVEEYAEALSLRAQWRVRINELTGENL